MLYGAYKLVEGILACIGIFIVLGLLTTPLAGVIILILCAVFISSMLTGKKNGSHNNTGTAQKGVYEDRYFHKLNNLYEEEANRRKSEWSKR